MITATCHNSDCTQVLVPVYFLGSPPHVECGSCVHLCSLSDFTEDPAEIEQTYEAPAADA